jgi:hypothetical protein
MYELGIMVQCKSNIAIEVDVYQKELETHENVAMQNE